MNKNKQNGRILEDVKISVKMKISALWVALMICYIYADFFSIYRPGQIDKIRSGLMGPFPVTEAGLLTASIMMAIPAILIFLSLILKPKANRRVNVISGVLYTAIGIGNLIGETWLYYLFLGIVEIVVTVVIVIFALKWPGGKIEQEEKNGI